MPMRIADYPPEWPKLSKRIRLERAGGQCECRGECGAKHGIADDIDADQLGRCQALNGEPLKSGRKVVLTVAHLCRPEDHDPPAKCGDEAHLLALCQSCHLRLDHPIHVQHARETRARRQGVQELPFTKGADHAPTVQEGRQPVHASEPRPPHEATASAGQDREEVAAQEPREVAEGGGRERASTHRNASTHAGPTSPSSRSEAGSSPGPAASARPVPLVCRVPTPGPFAEVLCQLAAGARRDCGKAAGVAPCK